MAGIVRSWRNPAAILLLLWGIAVSLLGYPPIGFWPLAVLGPAPLFVVAAVLPERARSLGYAYGFGFFGGLLYWLVHTLHVYGWLPLFASIPLYLLLVAYLALFPFVAMHLTARASRGHSGVAVCLAPLAWTAAEWVRGWLFSGFGWGDTPQALWRVGWALDLAPRVGADGVLLILSLLAGGAAWGILRLPFVRRDARPGLAALVPAGLALVAVFALPFVPDGVGPVAGKARIVVAQGNIDQNAKWDPEFRDETLTTYGRLTEEGLKGGPADFVLWPETAVPLWVQDPSPERARVEGMAQKARCDLVFGAPARAPDHSDRSLRNAVFRMDDKGTLVDRYDKMHLVPFGEYVPFGRNLPFIHTLVQASGNFTPGEEMRQFHVRGREGKGGPVLGPLICFESIFSSYAAEHAAEGAQMLALVTNDAWFGATSAPYQHLAYAAWRAAETGLPLVRAANTGISAAFDGRGRLVAETRLMVPAALVVELEYPATAHTPQARIRPWIGPLCLAVVVFVMLRRRRRNFSGK
jgi:apolipoprotein N-acyltransferase